MDELIGQTILFAGTQSMAGWVNSGETLKTTDGQTIPYLTKTGAGLLEGSHCVGQIMLFPSIYDSGPTGWKIPKGWALCNGASVHKRRYQVLYAVIGNKFGEKSDSFKLPKIGDLLKPEFANSPQFADAAGNLKYIICIEGCYPQ